MKGAGEKKHTAAKALGENIEAYFRSISRTVPAKDRAGEEIRNDKGEVIMLTQYLRPPGISALCLFLGIDRDTWERYSDAGQYPELADVTAQTHSRIEAYLEEELLTREKSMQGVIFNLQNNYGWKQKQELELGDKTRKSVQAESLSLQEKLALIAEAARSYAAGTDGKESNR